MKKFLKLCRHYKALVVVATTLTLCACASGTTSTDRLPKEERLIDEESDARILFAAAQDVFSQRGIDVALVAEEAMVITSNWEQINKELRHRTIVRVVEDRGGRRVRMNITSEYLRRSLIDGQEFWLPPEDELTKRRARKDELQLGTQIKERFEERKDM